MNICFRIVLLLLIINQSLSNAQVAPDSYWIEFTDKNDNNFNINEPNKFLSHRSLERRIRQDIPVTESDLPVSSIYLDSLKKFGLKIHLTSKWLNGAVIVSSDSLLIDTLHKLSFISNKINSTKVNTSIKTFVNKFPAMPKSAIDYGLSESQIKMLNGHLLHELNFDGKGMLIGILDSGFSNADELTSLNHVWENNQIIGMRDYVNDNRGFFDTHYHGTLVFSIIAGILPSEMYGTATKANYLLVRTENSSSEYLIEEYNWIAGAEYCDSMGVDVINSSLGYSEFNDSNQNHSYADLDGKTTPISRGAHIAARKGMLIVTSAGNSGDDPWQYITAPADADSILSIGAVNPTEIIADFSGKGPSSDGRIKPDISAQGVSTIGQISNNGTTSCNGTSCSSPVIAGLAACLWQSRPQVKVQELRQAIIQACDRFQWPDTLYGFGIPDFILAQSILDSITTIPNDLATIILAPNPVKDYSQLSATLPWLNSTKPGEINIYDINGRLIMRLLKDFNPGITIHPLPELTELELGYYIIRIAIDYRFYKIALIKI